jgi:hypothetical protein
MAQANNVPALVSVKFSFKKETKGAVCYNEDGHAPIIGTLYLRKSLFAKPEYPQTLHVVVTVSGSDKAKLA